MTYQLHPIQAAFSAQAEMTGNQSAGRAVQLADGGMLVVYAEQVRPDPDVFSFDYAIKAQRFDSAGNRVGGPQTMTELPDTTNVSFSPVATGLTGGGYAIAWRDDGSSQLRVQTYDADGVLLRDAQSPLPNRTITNAVGNEVSVEVFASTQPPALTGLETGGFAVTWNATHSGILAQYVGGATMYTQAFTQDGLAVTAPAQITNWIASVSFSQDRMNWIEDAAPLADGNYVIVFRAGDNHPDNPADRPGIMARIFDDTGTPVTANFLVNEELEWRKSAPSVDTLADGSFVVAWVDAGNFGPESATYWRRFDAEGNPVTDEQSLGARHSYVTVTALEDGGFILALSNVPSTGSPIGSTSAQRFDAENNPVGDITPLASARQDLDMSFLRGAVETVALDGGPLMAIFDAQAFASAETGANVVLRPFAPDLLGTADDDVLEAGEIGTALFGFAGNDTLIGGPGDDFLTGGPGDDLLLGGGGVNTAVFSGLVSEYDIARGGGDRLVVTDLRDGSPDGTDTLEDIAFLQFAKRHATDTTNIVEVAELDLDVTLAVMVIDRRGSMLEDVAVTFTPDEGAAQGGTTDAAGALMLDIPAGTGGSVTAALDYDGAPRITANDALDILRMSVGLEPSFGPATAYDYIAADVDRNARVDATDALEVLRHVVGLASDYAPEWVFVDADADLSGTSMNNVRYQTGVQLDGMDSDPGAAFVGILLGNMAEVV